LDAGLGAEIILFIYTLKIGGEGGVAVGIASLKKTGLQLLRVGFIFPDFRPKRDTAERPCSP
jgi:hypothetical protein